MTKSQAKALGGKYVSPLLDQLFETFADGSDLPVEIVKTERIDVTVVLPESSVPINLIGQAVPGKSENWHAIQLQAVHI